MSDEIERVLLDYVRENFLPKGTRARLAATDDLFETATIDSVGLITVVEFIENRFELKIADEDLVPDNFVSIRVAAAFIRRRIRERPRRPRRRAVRHV